jgi:PAT family acetyl-CoA transporter-like MFS transporter 1
LWHLSLPPTLLFLVQERVSYKQQALFSLVSLPFSFKLLWAPIVDSTSFWGLGRRKAWLLPVQCLCGVMMLLASPLVGGWMGEGAPEKTPDVQVREGKEGGKERGKEGGREALRSIEM